MIKKTIITRDKVRELWPNGPFGLSHYLRINDGNRLSFGSANFRDLPEYALRRLHTDLGDSIHASFNEGGVGIYRMKHLENVHEYTNFLISTRDVVTVEVPGVIETVEPILKKFMNGRYYIKQVRDQHELYLYYPEFTITNTIGESHLIKDMVVLLFLTAEGVFGEIRGKRFSFTKQELALGYVHSHLSTGYAEEDSFATFCLGDRSDLRKYMKTLEVSCNPDQFELLLVQIEHFLIWESMEGNPYISISKLFTNEEGGTNNLLPTSVRRDMAHEFVKRLKPTMLFALDDYTYVLNTGAAAGELYSLEQEIVADAIKARVITKDHLYDYDLETDTYQSSNRNYDGITLPRATKSVHKDVRDALSITPSLYETKQLTPRKTVVRRMSPNDRILIFQQVNDLLTYSHRINGQNNIVSESENINKRKATSADNSTAQPMSVEPRVVRAAAV